MSSAKVPDKVVDILRRVKATGLTDQDVHERARLTNGWLSQARAGRYSERAPSVKRLARWLAQYEGAESEEGPADGGAAVARALQFPRDPSRLQASPVGASLAEEAAKARTHRRCGKLLQRVASLYAAGEIDREMAETLERVIARRVQVLRHERAEKAVASVRALEVLTAEELALLREHRTRIAGPPLQPGVSVPPPPELTKSAEAKGPAGPVTPPP